MLLMPFLMIGGVVLAGAMLLTAHEFGHWIAARACRAWTPIFSLGYGRSYIVLGRWFGTQFRLCSKPFAGFVQIVMSPPSHSELEALVQEVGLEEAPEIRTMRPWQKAVILSAGIGMNILVTLLILLAIQLAQGHHLIDGLEGAFGLALADMKAALLWLAGLPSQQQALIYQDGSLLGAAHILAFASQSIQDFERSTAVASSQCRH